MELDLKKLSIKKLDNVVVYSYKIDENIVLQINYYINMEKFIDSQKGIWIFKYIKNKKRTYEYPSKFFNKYEHIIKEIDNMHAKENFYGLTARIPNRD